MKTLQCSKCKQIKPVSEFYPDKRNTNRKYASWCKSCKRKLDKAYSKEYYKKHRREILEKQKTVAGKRTIRWAKIKYKYGLTRNGYREIFNLQNGKCAICGVDLEILGTNTHVDHDHASGNIRGLLCASCNLGLGYFEDKSKLRSAIRYLENI
jgi:hypothetical protein